MKMRFATVMQHYSFECGDVKNRQSRATILNVTFVVMVRRVHNSHNTLVMCNHKKLQQLPHKGNVGSLGGITALLTVGNSRTSMITEQDLHGRKVSKIDNITQRV